MKYKALITDLDGTIIIQGSKNGLPSIKVTDALEKARSKINIGIATGRPPIYVSHILSHLKLSGPSILLNGALIIDSLTGKILYSEPMGIQEFNEIIKILKKRGLLFTIDQENEYAIKYTKSFKPSKPLVIFTQNLTLDQVEKIKKELAQIHTITAIQVPDWVNANKWALNICSAKATKLHAVVKVSEILKISPKEIIAIGDSYNDFPLLMACGLKVAMGNAVTELKEIADYIAPTIEEDGVADVIEKYILS